MLNVLDHHIKHRNGNSERDFVVIMRKMVGCATFLMCIKFFCDHVWSVSEAKCADQWGLSLSYI